MKKYIFFIIEGKHDKDEISAILNTPYFETFRSKYEPCFLQPNVGGQGRSVKCSTEAGGDITADKKTTASNIIRRLSELVNDYRRNGRGYPIAHGDIERIIQIVDTDGAFVPRSCVVRSTEINVIYQSSAIETANVDGVIGRNKKKAEVLQKLSTVTHVCNIPYSIYYVSCNMDHVLFEDRNMSRKRKTCYSLDFQSKCESQPNVIFESILKPGIATMCDYTTSWAEIQQGKESLQRRTNFNLFLSELAILPT